MVQVRPSADRRRPARGQGNRPPTNPSTSRTWIVPITVMLSWLARIPRAEARAMFLSVGVGVALLAIKFGAYLLTGSAAIFSDGMESIVNVLASLAALAALGYAHRPPDQGHPYGHGKAEFVSASFEGGMIVVASVVIVIMAIEAWVRGVMPQRLDLGLALVTVATLANGGVGLLLIRIGKRGGSITLEADGRHLLADAVTSIAALGALLLVRLTGHGWIDPLVALLIGVYIGRQGLALVRRGLAGLMDEQDAEDEQALLALLERHVAGAEPAVCGFHRLRHRHSGRYHWVDFHLKVPGGWDIQRGHAVASVIEREIEQLLGAGTATAHVEPCGRENCPRCRRSSAGAAASRPDASS